MYFIKKLTVLLFSIIAIFVIYQDLTQVATHSEKDKYKFEQKANPEPLAYHVIPIKVQAGDTVLSIVERLNPHLNDIHNINIFADFQLVNPESDPSSLTPGDIYYFPKYEK
ncbi:LysM peptidoglycan-binding domain-containing protein [Virgibacillus proomii]|uniref:LysM peptidoglycan-binding domain-containing protein n=1 Tax=Virgibacillus proomii TaxID=84407 RepID=UPI001C0FAAB1|nr:LysM peptidoglycan-binding domain-containing protein [Virgibacillus proomii]MBU5265911.1 hypothetical protein [Virgibacillus proomii]